MSYICFWKKNVQESKQLISNISELYFVAGFGYSAKNVDSKSNFVSFFLRKLTPSWSLRCVKEIACGVRHVENVHKQTDWENLRSKQNSLRNNKNKILWPLLGITNLSVRVPRYHNLFNNIFPAYLLLKSINISSAMSLFFYFISPPFLE